MKKQKRTESKLSEKKNKDWTESTKLKKKQRWRRLPKQTGENCKNKLRCNKKEMRRSFDFGRFS